LLKLPLRERRLLFGKVVTRPSGWEWSIDGAAPVLLLPAIDALMGESCRDGSLENSDCTSRYS
jgi:hypothetical protein